MRIHRGLALVLGLAVAAACGVSAGAQQRAGAPHPAKLQHKRRATDSAAGRANAAQAKPKLIEQYSHWGAYTASPGGEKICFAIAKPVTAVTNPPHRLRDQPYFFVTTRPADKVTNEVYIDFGYPLKHEAPAKVQIGQTSYALYTEGSGAWIKSASAEAHMVADMRKGQTAVVLGVSTHDTKTTDTYSLIGVSQALDRIAQACSQ